MHVLAGFIPRLLRFSKKIPAGHQAALVKVMDTAHPENNARFAAQLRAKRLQPVSLYTGARVHKAGIAGETVARILAAAKVCQEAGFQVISCNADPIGRQKTDAELAMQAASLSELGRGLSRLGLKLGIHHHMPEMATMKPCCPLALAKRRGFGLLHGMKRTASVMLGVLLTLMVSQAETAIGDGSSGSAGPNLTGLKPPPTRLDLSGSVLVVNGDEPSSVLHLVRELSGYLGEITGRESRIQSGIAGAGGPFILVGPGIAGPVLDEPLPQQALGEEGYFVKSLTNRQGSFLVVAGATPKGTRNGLAGLLAMIKAEGKRACVESPLRVVSKPSFPVRGFHFNGWMFNHPYSFRLWNEAEWKSYIDVLGCQRVNLLYLWPFMEIIPLPISAEDRAYLEEVRRVVDYAQKEHGMEVWIMQAANRVARNNLGVANPRLRPYWRPDVQVDLNPANQDDFRRIMESHEALYKIVNNVDGVCTIDTDPGSYPGSSLEDYVRIFNGCRALLDKHSARGRQTKLVNWMWMGWGLEHPSDPKWQAKTVRMLKESLPEPWWLVAGHEDYLPASRDAGALGKTIYLRYGTIEDEPSYPGTNPGLGFVPQMIDLAAGQPGLGGVMGNAQCPLLQFPRIYHQLDCCWDARRAHRPEREVLLELSALLYPENKDLIADAYAALTETEVAKLGVLVAKLDRVIADDKLGRPGLFGRKLFPEPSFVAQSLLLQLKLRLSLQTLYSQLKPDCTRAECSKLVEDCLDNYLMVGSRPRLA